MVKSYMKRWLFVAVSVWMAVACAAHGVDSFVASVPEGQSEGDFIRAPYNCVIKKFSYKRRYGDITTNGRFAVLKVVFTNKDAEEHFVDYPCFYLTDAEGVEYEVHTEATIVRQTYFEDWKIKDVDVEGLSNKTVRPNLSVKGFLVFEVPGKGDYQLGFRGYLK